MRNHQPGTLVASLCSEGFGCYTSGVTARARDLAAMALDSARRQAGVDYADVRVSSERRERIRARNDEAPEVAGHHSEGIGVRARVDGAWGFGAMPGFDERSAHTAAIAAAEIARAVSRSIPAAERMRDGADEEPPALGSYRTPVIQPPDSVPLEHKISDLRAAIAEMHPSTDPRIVAATGQMMWEQIDKVTATTEGTCVEQRLCSGGAGIQIVCRDDTGTVRRSWPMDFDGGLLGGGYEIVGALALVPHARELRQQALELLAAPPCPARTTTLVLDTPQLALQIHESCGHPTELDRALGEEISLAGSSFLTPDLLGRFRYGSPQVNLVADARTAGGLGTFGWDDEGVPARRTPLVSRGVFVGYLSSRHTAHAIGLSRSAGCLRSESWARPPIVRMTNVSLMPDPQGPASLDALIADTADGVLMTTNTSWSIDDLRLNFHFGCEAAWEIRRGHKGRMLRAPMYRGVTPTFWRGLDAVCSDAAWNVWGFASCGKGDPIQSIGVSHGCAPARFRDVAVGSP